MSKAAIILAAGAGTRMKSMLPKVLHKVAALPLLGHVVAALRAAEVERIVVVTSPAGEAVGDYARALGCAVAVQHQQLGTGHAAASAKETLADFAGTLLVINGDMPLVTGDTITECLKASAPTGLALMAFEAKDPGAYGRVLLTPDGFLNRIVEYKDATLSERALTLCNAGCYAADARNFFRWASSLHNHNAQKEYYLTDVPLLARDQGVKCAIAPADEVSVTGVNSRAELAQAESKYQARIRTRMLADGVTMTAPETVFFAHDTAVENDVEIEPFVVFGPGVTVRSGARLRSHSHLEGATIASGAIIGPFARLRPGARIGEDVHIGNFVEVKNTVIEKGAKANHLTYLGDARVGAGANIGAGTITCNYDGFTKAITDIGAGAFIGSDTALVAPVKIGDGAVTAAGSVITRDIAPDALAIARGVLTEKPGWAKAFRERKRTEQK
ncbi:MAG TPA: bifunctional UDP-N-acetylglucosamine diphosphorylase/glucosamine-1-phosphate N-acetyltransferase GlmU [Rhizomicrobium sp.]|jgi:bifunctional UDP-N-acetylglucosamine pyrophosphorylase/glucosamine-1-phosphate N-acetyltransferase|nr:bifunctional UDP-N-acetylglucosamine diphosphorylase/glucosamine-1-phosphate N-acetyltransferase GlmU [Rhizomicrobium sp.]